MHLPKAQCHNAVANLVDVCNTDSKESQFGYPPASRGLCDYLLWALLARKHSGPPPQATRTSPAGPHPAYVQLSTDPQGRAARSGPAWAPPLLSRHQDQALE